MTVNQFFSLYETLVQAQLERGNKELIKRLQQDVEDRDIDLDNDKSYLQLFFSQRRLNMTKVDETYQKTGLIE